MKKNIFSVLFYVLGVAMSIANIVCGFFYIQGYYYWKIAFACAGIAGILLLVLGCIIKPRKKRRRLKRREDVSERKKVEPDKLVKLVENLHMYVNYENEEERARVYGRTLAKNREHYEFAVLILLENLFKDKSKSEIDRAIMAMKKKL